MQKAALLIDAYRTEEAIELLQQCLASDPESIEGLDLLGMALQMEGRYEELEIAATRLIAVIPDEHGGYFRHGMALHGLGRNVEALADLDRACSLGFHVPGCHMMRAMVLAHLPGQSEEAIAAGERALSLAPNDADLMGGMADVYAQLGDKATAQTWYLKALAQDPNDLGSLHNLEVARAMRWWNNPLTTMRRMESILQLNANLEAANRNLEVEAFRQGARTLVLGLVAAVGVATLGVYVGRPESWVLAVASTIGLVGLVAYTFIAMPRSVRDNLLQQWTRRRVAAVVMAVIGVPLPVAAAAKELTESNLGSLATTAIVATCGGLAGHYSSTRKDRKLLKQARKHG